MSDSNRDFEEEIVSLRSDLNSLNQEVINMRNLLQHFVHVFNERVTDLYGEIAHIKKFGSSASRTPRETVVVQNWLN